MAAGQSLGLFTIWGIALGNMRSGGYHNDNYWLKMKMGKTGLAKNH
jgi:hypothetical protein